MAVAEGVEGLVVAEVALVEEAMIVEDMIGVVVILLEGVGIEEATGAEPEDMRHTKALIVPLGPCIGTTRSENLSRRIRFAWAPGFLLTGNFDFRKKGCFCLKLSRGWRAAKMAAPLKAMEQVFKEAYGIHTDSGLFEFKQVKLLLEVHSALETVSNILITFLRIRKSAPPVVRRKKYLTKHEYDFHFGRTVASGV